MAQLQESGTTAPEIASPTPEAEEIYRRWIGHLDDEFSRHSKPVLRAEIVRVQLHQLLLSRPIGGKLNFTLTTELPTNVFQLSLDPRNITLCAEYAEELDRKKYDERKPLIWFWQMFDRSPVGLNLWLGFRFRAMLARHIFEHIGKNVILYPGIDLSFGYNLTVEDDCIINANVTLNDREPLRIDRGTSVPAGAVLPQEGSEKLCSGRG
jgi:hypothetical protein